MSIRNQILEYSQNHSFDETVVKFFNQIVSEKTLSDKKDKIYVGEWQLRDGSSVSFKGETFF